MRLIAQKGFVSVTLIAISVAVVVTGGVGFIFKDEILEAIRRDAPDEQEESAPVNNPFPTRPPGPAGEPRERSTLPGDGGEPYTEPPVNAAGEWHGNFTIAAPGLCAGEEGGWEALISDVGGAVSGTFTAEGFGGAVSGTRTGTTTQWNVGGAGSGISFRGDISGNTVSGTFTGPECPYTEQRTSGTFFGGRIVP